MLAFSSDGFAHPLKFHDGLPTRTTMTTIRQRYFVELELVEADFTHCTVTEIRLVPPTSVLQWPGYLLGHRQVELSCIEQGRVTLVETHRRVIRSLWRYREFWSSGGQVSELCQQVRRCQTVSDIAVCLNGVNKPSNEN